MCGIFGIIAKESNYKTEKLMSIFEDLAKLSQVRGKDSSGFACRFESDQEIKVLKGPVSIEELLKTNEYKDLKTKIFTKENKNTENIFSVLGHSRLVTNGTQLEECNNQPVIKDGIVGVHNGIIVNDDDMWKKHNEIKREFGIDTEIIFALIRKFIDLGNSVVNSCIMATSELFGTISMGFMLNDYEEFVLFTNNGSLYTLTNNKDIFLFSSEKNILVKLIKKYAGILSKKAFIQQVSPNSGIIINYYNFYGQEFNIQEINKTDIQNEKHNDFNIKITNYRPSKKQVTMIVDSNKFMMNHISSLEKTLLEYNIDGISKLRRCKRCILPESFPFIEFDDKGICNICNNYTIKNRPKPIIELQELAELYKKKDGQPDCLVPFSGGRDSTYTLHIVKNVLKMNPIAFTYDWGMVTDLGRRNIARVTGKMGVENIIVSADIRWKRKNIRKNITAWLQNPELGMIPLFMAGDKFFFYYTDKVKKQNDIKLNIWGINPLENTDFKVGFCGLPLRFNKKRIYSISIADQIKLFGYVGKNVIKSPKYINQSVIDTLGSFASRYFVKKSDYFHMFDYYQWDEKEIEDLIINEYKWETAKDTKTTWRIGDGTAGFYNYVYYTVAGFSEYDTFRSNQIREGMLDREEALKLVDEENKPRYESIKWYLEILGLDFETVIKRINKIPKLYKV